MRKRNVLSLFVSVFFLFVCVGHVFADVPKNIIFMIGDGKGFEQDKAASIYRYGSEGNLVYESFPYYGEVTTNSYGDVLTDSAAAATAMATGYKVDNGVISKLIPGDESELETLLEYFRDRGKSTGLVTTVYISHATPAGFGAHEKDRGEYTLIAGDYLNQTTPNILFGGTASSSTGINFYDVTTYGYSVVTDYTGLTGAFGNYISGQFATGALPYEYDGTFGSKPHLSDMAYYALRILDDDSDGFFIVIEGGMIDWAGHDNNIRRNIHETYEFENTVQVVLNWINSQTNPEETLLIITADHETGGLQVLQNFGQGNYPVVGTDITWSTTGHTTANVPVYAQGENANLFFWTIDNTDYFELITCPNKPVRIARATPVYYDSIQTAYDAAANGETIQAMTAIITEDINFDRAITLTFEGGYDCYYTENVDTTVLRGDSIISDGTMIVENFYLEL